MFDIRSNPISLHLEMCIQIWPTSISTDNIEAILNVDVHETDSSYLVLVTRYTVQETYNVLTTIAQSCTMHTA